MKKKSVYQIEHESKTKQTEDTAPTPTPLPLPVMRYDVTGKVVLAHV